MSVTVLRSLCIWLIAPLQFSPRSRIPSLRDVHIKDFPGGTMDRMHPAKEGTWVQSLVREDSTCHRATKLRAPQLLKLTCPGARALQEEKPLHSEPRAPQLESSPCSLQQEKTPSQQQRPAQPKVKNKCFKEGYTHLHDYCAAAAAKSLRRVRLCVTP